MTTLNTYIEVGVKSLHVFDKFTVRRKPKESACCSKALD
jgi:hypothetical protein